jgi:hypothetical protein
MQLTRIRQSDFNMGRKKKRPVRKSKPRTYRRMFRDLKTRVRKKIARIRGRQIVHVLHVGKTGGTAVKEALRPHRSTGTFLLEFHLHGTTLSDIPRGEKVVFFVRDPISRFVSAFCSRLRRGRPKYFTKWTKREKAAFMEFETPNRLALAIESEFEDERKRARRAMRSIHHVRSSYWDWFKNERHFLSRLNDIIFIGSQETLADDFEKLKARLGLPDDVQLPDDDVKAHRNTTKIDTKLDERAKANLRKWYERDYQFMELCRKHLPKINDGVATSRA